MFLNLNAFSYSKYIKKETLIYTKLLESFKKLYGGDDIIKSHSQKSVRIKVFEVWIKSFHMSNICHIKGCALCYIETSFDCPCISVWFYYSFSSTHYNSTWKLVLSCTTETGENFYMPLDKHLWLLYI